MSHAYYLIVKTAHSQKLYAMKAYSLAAYNQLKSAYDHPDYDSFAIPAEKSDIVQIMGATVGGRFLDTQGRFLPGTFSRSELIDGEFFYWKLLCDNPTKSRSAAAIMAQRKGY